LRNKDLARSSIEKERKARPETSLCTMSIANEKGVFGDQRPCSG
jgi:hypothetical protein